MRPAPCFADPLARALRSRQGISEAGAGAGAAGRGTGAAGYACGVRLARL